MKFSRLILNKNDLSIDLCGNVKYYYHIGEPLDKNQ